MERTLKADRCHYAGKSMQKSQTKIPISLTIYLHGSSDLYGDFSLSRQSTFARSIFSLKSFWGFVEVEQGQEGVHNNWVRCRQLLRAAASSHFFLGGFHGRKHPTGFQPRVYIHLLAPLCLVAAKSYGNSRSFSSSAEDAAVRSACWALAVGAGQRVDSVRLRQGTSRALWVGGSGRRGLWAFLAAPRWPFPFLCDHVLRALDRQRHGDIFERKQARAVIPGTSTAFAFCLPIASLSVCACETTGRYLLAGKARLSPSLDETRGWASKERASKDSQRGLRVGGGSATVGDVETALCPQKPIPVMALVWVVFGSIYLHQLAKEASAGVGSTRACPAAGFAAHGSHLPKPIPPDRRKHPLRSGTMCKTPREWCDCWGDRQAHGPRPGHREGEPGKPGRLLGRARTFPRAISRLWRLHCHPLLPKNALGNGYHLPCAPSPSPQGRDVWIAAACLRWLWHDSKQTHAHGTPRVMEKAKPKSRDSQHREQSVFLP